MTQLTDDILYDVRLVRRHIRAGLITKADYEKYLSSKVNVEDQGEPTGLFGAEVEKPDPASPQESDPSDA